MPTNTTDDAPPGPTISLTEDQTKIIADNPLDLGRIRAALQDRTEESSRYVVARILLRILSSDAADCLKSIPSVRAVLYRLQNAVTGIENGTRNLDRFTPLVAAVSAATPDTNIWAIVLGLHDTDTDTTPRTPRRLSIAATYDGTPVKYSPNRLNDSATSGAVENDLFSEIQNCTFRGVGGFWNKFFNPDIWQDGPKQMLHRIMAEQDRDGKWKGFPAIPDEKPVWHWLCSLEERCLTGAANKLYTTKTAFDSKEQKGRMELFFQPHAVLAESSDVSNYNTVLIVGEQKRLLDSDRFEADFLQLTRLVRNVFAAQPTRRFIHAFSLYASTMELWVFDRSGPYSSGAFDIHKEPHKFARAFVGYATMDRAALGLDIFIDNKQVTLHNTGNSRGGKEIRVKLTDLLNKQRAIVSRGTACYKTQDEQVAKFSWAPVKRELEVNQLKRAQDKGVKGIAKVVGYRQITTIAELRAGLRFSEPYHFQKSSNQSSGAGSAKTLGHKRKFSDTFSSTPRNKRRSTRKPNLTQGFSDQSSTDTTNQDGDKIKQQWEDRIYSCLVISPVGRIISDFNSVKELLEAMRDAIRAHLSLYEVGQILHRDISPNNIIISNPEKSDGFKGLLIDLDLAKERNSGARKSEQQTGTIEFMAVEVLGKGVDHTYRHDLESFFYVLLWMCALESWSKHQLNSKKGVKMQPPVSLLQKWSHGTSKDIAVIKASYMTNYGFGEILEEFPDSFDVVKPLCWKIRNLLFSSNKYQIGFDTPVNHSDLYGPIIEAYNDAIKSVR